MQWNNFLKKRETMENKIKIVLFGAANAMLQAASESLRNDTCEIVAFCDNNEHKQGIIWNELPILSIDKLNEVEYDFIVVGAWFSYQYIRQNLIDAGISESKILPLLSIKSISLLTNPVGPYPEEILSKIFYDDPKKLNNKLKELTEVTKKYSSTTPMDVSNIFNEYPLIAHAGGGIYVNNRPVIYTNSIEAFETSIKSGFKMIEVDAWGLVDDDITFGHDSEKINNCISCNCTPLKFTDIIKILAKNADLRVMLDIKWSTFFDYKQILDQMEMLLSNDSEQWNYDVKQQFIVQTYDQETINYATKNGWNCVLISYRAVESTWFEKSAWLCCEFGLMAAIFPASTILKASKYLKFLKDKNVPIISYTTDDIEECAKLRRLGVVSVITNFLKPRII